MGVSTPTLFPLDLQEPLFSLSILSFLHAVHLSRIGGAPPPIDASQIISHYNALPVLWSSHLTGASGRGLQHSRALSPLGSWAREPSIS